MDGASLPVKQSHEFRPFMHRLPEFKFWYAIPRLMEAPEVVDFACQALEAWAATEGSWNQLVESS